MQQAQVVIGAIGRQRLGAGGGEDIGLARRDQTARAPVVDQARRTGGPGGHHRQSAGHCLQRDIAESLGDRRIEEDIAARQRLAQIPAGLEAGENAAGQRLFEPFARGPVADYQNLVRDLALTQLHDRFGKDVEPLFHHQAAEEHDCHIVIGQAMRAAPCMIALGRIEDRAVDPARPDRNVVMHCLRGEFGDLALRWRHQRIAALVEAAQHAFDQRFEETETVIARVGFEPRMDRCQHRDILRARPFERAVRGRVGR